MKKKVGNYKGKAIVEGVGEVSLLKHELLFNPNQSKEISGTSSKKMRYFYFNDKQMVSLLGFFTIYPYRSIIDNKITIIPLVVQINENYYAISNILFIDSSDNPYFFNEHYPNIAVKDLDELLEKEIEDFGCLKDYVTEISEEDALNINNYELQSNNTYKYIKI